MCCTKGSFLKRGALLYLHFSIEVSKFVPSWVLKTQMYLISNITSDATPIDVPTDLVTYSPRWHHWFATGQVPKLVCWGQHYAITRLYVRAQLINKNQRAKFKVLLAYSFVTNYLIWEFQNHKWHDLHCFMRFYMNILSPNVYSMAHALASSLHIKIKI